MTEVATTPSTAAELRAQLADKLISGNWIRADTAEAAAFRVVPREAFVPAGTSLQDAYADDVVVTRRGPDGKATSSVSAPWVHAFSLAQAALRPGSSVAEVGSGGYLAALAAEVVGPAGAVTTVDIDPAVVTAARTALHAAGYPQVRVVHADAEYGVPGGGRYDAIIVTVESADVPPSWTAQLADTGRLVVPLRLRGHTRYLTMRRDSDHLRAAAALQCGFVTMQGAGRQPTRRYPLRGDDAVLIVDDTTTQVAADVLAAALNGPRAQASSTVRISGSEGAGFEQLHLWLASQPRPYGVLNVNRERTLGLLDPQDKFTCPTLLTDTSLAYLTMHKAGPDSGAGGWEFGAHGFGPDRTWLAAELVDLVAVWDRHHRYGPGPQITVHPAGCGLPDTAGLRLLVRRRHTTIAVTWPTGDQR